MRVSDVLKLLREKDGSARVLAEETLDLTRQQMLLYPEKEISEQIRALLEKRLLELENGRPLQYILGRWEFEGRQFCVGEGVLIPREDTEAVLNLAKQVLKSRSNAVFADLGSGSGCIAVSLNLDCGAKGYAVERSEKAFCYLEKNIKALGAEITAVLGDMFEPQLIEALPQLDLVVSNPPYIMGAEMQELEPSVLREPHEALFGGEDGLEYYRKICNMYYPKLKEGGAIAFEVGFKQADEVSKILKKAGFHSLREQKDLGEIRRAVCAFK